VFHECTAVLEREVGVEPAAETRAAYDALLARDASTGAPGPAVGPPLVGRSEERATLAGTWRRAQRGPPRMVLLTGEPGIGKTRLAQELRSWCAHRGAATATARAYPGAGELAYRPVVTWLRSTALDPAAHGLARPHLSELARILPDLLVTVRGLAAPERLPESEQRQRLCDAVALALAAPGAPLLLVADDLQWWDRESLQLVHNLLRRRHAVPLLVVGTARQEDIAGSAALSDLRVALRAVGALTEVELERLDQAHTARLVETLGDRRLGDTDAAALHLQTEGIPLFVVEALRGGWRPGGSALTPRGQALIESRFAQLSDPARELVDVAATAGREFTPDLLAAVAGLDEEAVVRGLDELWRRRIIREHDEAAYDFSHDKLREVAYAALSPVRRRYLHGRVAVALEHAHRDDLDQVSGRLARHYEESGAPAEAVASYARAAEAAQRLYAHVESVRLLTRALELLDRLPPTRERSATELDLSTALLAPLVATEGYASDRIRAAHQRALSLCRTLGVEPTAPLLRSIGLGCLADGDFAGARRCAEQLRDRAERDGDEVLRTEGEYLLGVTAFWAAELTEARTHLERAVQCCRDEDVREHLLRYAQEPKAICLTRLALTHWFLGDRERALLARDAGLARAEEVGHPYTLSVALLFSAVLAMDMQDLPALRRTVTRAEAVLPDVVGVQSRASIRMLRGYLELVDGRVEDRPAALRRVAEEARPRHQAAPGERSTILRILMAAADAADDSTTALAAAEELAGLTSSLVWRPAAERLLATYRGVHAPANG
jgi:hypothetical protein